MRKKPRAFVGSSAERLYLAEAIQANLERDVEVTIWNQGPFEQPSAYPLEVLEHAASQSDIGIFVLAPDDLGGVRGETLTTVRDNVLFELGLFMGAMGRRRSFIVVPRRRKTLRLPSDLIGLGPLEYDDRRGDKNWRAALGPACSTIRQVLRTLKSTRKDDLFVHKLVWFQDASSIFDELIPNVRRVTTFFIHSRRWRENHLHLLNKFLSKPSAKLTAYLPDPADSILASTFLRNFDDGSGIPGFIADACRFYSRLLKRFPRKVTVNFVRHYPTYSFYLLDKTAIIAMYPTTDRRRPVPTMQVPLDSPIGQFLMDDLERLQQTSRRVSTKELAGFR